MEGSVAPIAEEALGQRLVLAGITVLEGTAATGISEREAALVIGEAEVDVVAHVEVQPAVPVIVQESRADTPTRVIRAGCPGHIVKGSIPVVSKQLVGPEIGQVEVGPTIIVEVSRCHAHPVPWCPDPTSLRHVGKVQPATAGFVRPQVVSVEPVDQRFGLGRGEDRIGKSFPRSEHAALNQIEVEIPVVVIIEHGSTGAHHFAQVAFPRHAVEVDEIDPCFPRGIQEDIAGCRFSFLLRRIDGLLQTLGQRDVQ